MNAKIPQAVELDDISIDSSDAKGTVNKYFDMYFSALKTGKLNNLDSILVDPILKEYIDLLVLSDYDYNTKLGMNIYDYEFNVTFNDVSIKKNKYILNVDLAYNLACNTPDNITKAERINYIFVLEQHGDKLYISSIIHEDDEKADPSKVNDPNYLKGKLDSLIQKNKNIDNIISELSKTKADIEKSH